MMALYLEAIGHRKEGFSQDSDTEAMVAEIGSLLQECKSVARGMKVGRPSRCLSGPFLGLEPPSREVADKMATMYFNSFESTHRILHEPTFWTEYNKYWDEPHSITMGRQLKLLLAIAIGSGLSEADAALRSLAHYWVYTAQAWLSGPLEKDRMNIVGLQVHCLTILARQVLSIGADLAWISMGQLLHCGMQLGLHRNPKHSLSMSVMQGELRRRLWATILEFYVQLSLDAAMAPRISLDEFDTLAPSNINDDEMNESTAVLEPHPRTTFTSTSIQLMLLDSLPTRLRIVQALNSLRSEPAYPEALTLSSQITDACRVHTTLPTSSQEPHVTPFRRNLLDYLVRRFLLPLHSLFVTKARMDPSFYYSLKASLNAAITLTSPEPDEAFERLTTIGGGSFREGFRCAVTAICVELLAHTDAQKLDGTLHRDSQYRNLLKQKLQGLLSFSAERIRAGETNIKMHLFLSMVLAQVEAVEDGSAVKAAIAKSGKDSLVFCHDLLRTLASKSATLTPDDVGPTPNFDSGQEDYWWDSDVQLLFGAEFT